MRPIRLLGTLLLGLAVAAATAEGFARAEGIGGGRFFLPLIEVAAALWPERLVGFLSDIRALPGGALWPPLLETLFRLPGWILFGGPGLIVLWRAPGRAGDTPRGAADEDNPYDLFDDLARSAEQEGVHDTDPGMGPNLMQDGDITPPDPPLDSAPDSPDMAETPDFPPPAER